MLQRIVTKPPTLLKNNPNDNVIFTKDGRVRELYNKFCLEMNINPVDLFPKSFDSFHEPHITHNIQILRYNNAENKRRAKVEALRALARQHIRNQNNNNPPSPKASPQVQEDSQDPLSVTQQAFRPPSTSQERRPSFYLNKLNESHSSHMYSNNNKNEKSLTSDSKHFITEVNIDSEMPSTKHTAPDAFRFYKQRRMTMALDESHIVKEMHDRQQRQIDLRKLRTQRTMVAPVIVNEQNEMYKENSRMYHDTKATKFSRQRTMILSASNKRALEAREEMEEYRKEKLQENKNSEVKRIRKLREKLLGKMVKSENHKKQEDQKLLRRIIDKSNAYEERHQSCMEKREFENSCFPEQSVMMAEDKQLTTAMRKQYIIEEKQDSAYRHNLEIEEKLSKAKEQEKERAQKVLQKVVNKLDRKRSMSASTARANMKKPPLPINEDEMYKFRTKELKDNQLKEEKAAVDKYKKRELRGLMSVERRNHILSDFIAERQEIWNLKKENREENKKLETEAINKYHEQRLTSYKLKVESIKRAKERHFRGSDNLNRSVH